MKNIIKKIRVGLAAAVVSGCIAGQVMAAGLLTPKNSNHPSLDITEHSVKVIIEDGYAITTVDQVFYNPHNEDLEAIYSFPVPEKGAVSEFTMWIDGKPIHGEVLEKKKAREVYEEQKAQGNNTGVAEKNEYKTFEISVFPVRSGDETRIRLSYIQPLKVDSGIGEYVYPLEEGGVDEEALSFWSTNDQVKGQFSFDLLLRPDYPVDGIRLPNHPQAVVTQTTDGWAIHMDNHSTPAVAQADDALTINNADRETPLANPVTECRLDTDIVMYYRHVENLPGSVDLLAYKKDNSGRGTFMLTVTPGMDLEQISEGRDWVFILDKSGSMSGKYATLVEGVRRALEKMSDLERFRIITFNNRAQELTNGFMPATPENVEKYCNKVAAIQPDNGTNLYAGLSLGLKKLDADRTSSIILVTDGVANVGVTQQRDFIELVKKYDVRLFTFIMGNSANRPLLEVLTKTSHGFALTVSNSDDIIGKILQAKSKVHHKALHGVSLDIKGVKTADITPRDIDSLYRGQQLVVFGHYFKGGKASVTLRGKISGEEKTYSTTFDFPETATENPELERLWAYATIEDITNEMDNFGENPDLKQSVIDIGTEYSLVTDYTSMVVVEDEVFEKLGIDRKNKERLEQERKAREARSQKPSGSNRVDQHQPMFSHNRPTMQNYSGGAGAFDPLSLLLLLPLLYGLGWGRKKQN